MKARLVPLVLVFGIALAWGIVASALEAQTPQATEHPYKAFAPWMETSVRFVSDVSVPGGPSFKVKVYDWVIGPRREVPTFPLEGFATIQLLSGELETTIGRVTVERQAGDFWVVPPGTKFGIRVKAEATYGDNLAILHGVVMIRK
jgi:quercetin dioxygenase-like cupin family protein